MCEKQTSVSDCSTESEIISLDAGLRLDGNPALDLWDLIVAVLHGNTSQSNQERGDTESATFWVNESRAIPLLTVTDVNHNSIFILFLVKRE